MLLLIILFLVIVFLLYLLFAKMHIEINSETEIYRIRFNKLLSISLKTVNASFKLEVKFLWWRKTIDTRRTNMNQKKYEETHIKYVREKKKIKLKANFKKTINIIKSFKINKCSILIDTGIMPLNGILYPWFYILSIRTKKNIMINFKGENVVILEIENSIARMLWAYIKS